MEPTKRRAVVTGGGRGIGRAIAAALSKAGHDVTVLGRTESALKEAVKAGAAKAFRQIDVTDSSTLSSSLAEIGAVDILINNAGIADSAPFVKTDLAFFHRVMAVNFDSVVVATRAVMPGMIERGFGRIVSIASISGLKGFPYVSAYVASKHAVVGLTRALAQEVARTGVTVNAVCPGYVDTELVSRNAERIAAKSGRTADEVTKEFFKGNPQGRLVTVEEVAEAVLWLTGDRAASVNGQAIAIDGGET